MFFSRFGGSLNPLNQVKDRNAIDTTKDTTAGTQAKDQWRQTVSEEKKAAVHEEMKRMNQLPSNSTYATHRLRVLNKVLHLLSIQVYEHQVLFILAHFLIRTCLLFWL